MSDNIPPKEVTRCPCASSKDDGGLMIQCNICKTWQHARCVNIKSKSKAPAKYSCPLCTQPKKVTIAQKHKIEKKDNKVSTKDKMVAGPSTLRPGCIACTLSASLSSPVASTSSGSRFFHDENLLYYGGRPNMSRRQDDAAAQRRRNGLRQSFGIISGLQELTDYMNALKQKIDISGTRNMVKAYIWSDTWFKDDVKKEGLKKEAANKCAKKKVAQEAPKKKDVNNDSGICCEMEDSKDNIIDTSVEMDCDQGSSKKEQPKKEVVNKDAKMDCEEDAETDLPEMARLVDNHRTNLLENILNTQSQVSNRLQEYTQQIQGMNTNSTVGDRRDEDEDETSFDALMESLINDMRNLKRFSEEDD